MNTEQKILSVLTESNEKVALKEIANQIGKSLNTTLVAVKRLITKELVTKEKKKVINGKSRTTTYVSLITTENNVETIMDLRIFGKRKEINEENLLTIIKDHDMHFYRRVKKGGNDYSALKKFLLYASLL